MTEALALALVLALALALALVLALLSYVRALRPFSLHSLTSVLRSPTLALALVISSVVDGRAPFTVTVTILCSWQQPEHSWLQYQTRQ